jgi:hypothetical protein
MPSPDHPSNGQNSPSQFVELLRLFWQRFLDNDLIAPQAETRLALVPILGLLAIPGVIFSLRSYGQYSFLWTRLGYPVPAFPLDLTVSWSDKFLFLYLSMILMGFITVLEWDALFPDSRDYLILAPLPIRLRTLLTAKITALFLFLLVFTLALNGCSSILFPLMAMNPSAPAGYALRYIGAHGTAVFAANTFVLLFCVALQGVLMNALSARHFQWISRTVQLFLLFLFVCLFLLLPRTFSFVKGLDLDNNAFIHFLPPMWFTGLYETLQGSDHPGVQGLASLAGQALAGALVMFIVTYMASFRRHVRRSLESSDTVLPSTVEWTRFGLQRLDSLFLRKPVERAIFHFACRTILRNPQHRLYLGAYAGTGLALTLVGIASTVLRSADVGIEPFDPSLLSIPLVLSFFILCGLRFIFTVPAELSANWIFRLVQDAPSQEYLSGVRKVMWIFGVVPLPASLFPFYGALWGVEASLLHLFFVVTLAGILTEVLLIRFQKVPFTCSYLPGKANIKLYWFPYVASFALYAYGMASIERLMLECRVRFVIFYAAAFVFLCYLHVKRRQLPLSERVVIFEELPEPAVRTLNLGP